MQLAPTAFASRQKYAGPAALLAGGLYIAQAIINLIAPQPEIFSTFSDYLIEAIFVAALAMTLAGLAGLRQRYVRRTDRLANVGFGFAMVGTTCLLISASTTLVVGKNALGLVFVLGILCALLGHISFGIGLFRTSQIPRSTALALIAGLPLSFLLATFGGAILLGLSWLVIGAGLHTVVAKEEA